MRDSSWDECIDEHSSITVSPDKAKARSLIDIARGRIDFISKNKATSETANYIFEAHYTSVLEILKAIVALGASKVSNHICLGFYLRDVLDRNELYRLFDDCRSKRNGFVYYGRTMNYETAKQVIEKCNLLFKELLQIASKRLK